jgi:hypothetical protein
VKKSALLGDHESVSETGDTFYEQAESDGEDEHTNDGDSSILWDITACSSLNSTDDSEERVAHRNKHEVGGSYCLVYSSALKMDATCSSEMSDDFSTGYTALQPRRQKNSS